MRCSQVACQDMELQTPFLPPLQQIYIAVNNLCSAFVDLEKVFSDAPRDFVCWALRKQDVEAGFSFKFFVKG